MEGALHSLSNLGMDYIDLYLIHWPGTRGLDVIDQRNPGAYRWICVRLSLQFFSRLMKVVPAGNRAQSWAALEELHAQGKLKAIGVSNYTPSHMRELMASCKVRPAVLQVW